MLTALAMIALAAEPNVTSGHLEATHPLQEWSGLSPCHSGLGHWWGINDGGNPAELVLLGGDLTVLGRFSISVMNQDWEDLAWAEGTLYVADIGDNNRTRQSVQVHALPEPKRLDVEQPLRPDRTWTLRYPQQPRDAEAFVVSGTHGWIIDKRLAAAGIWRFDLDGDVQQTLTHMATCPLPGPILAADLSPTGDQLALAFPLGIHVVPLNQGDLSTLAFDRVQTVWLPMSIQREAVAFQANGRAILAGDEQRRWWLVPMPGE